MKRIVGCQNNTFSCKKMKIAYFNCSSGISGDMLISSCLDCGIDKKLFEEEIKRCLRFRNWGLKVKKVKRGHLSAIQISFLSDKKFSSIQEMKKTILKSKFSSDIKNKSIEIFNLLTEAESKVHKLPSKKIHFHELNSLDTILDITGTLWLISKLKPEKIFASEINVGNPAPATVEIVKSKKLPVFSNTVKYELATPTGVAIISSIAEFSQNSPNMRIEKIGYGAGTFEIEGSSNVLKLFLGETSSEEKTGYIFEKLILLETNIDDMDPRIYPYLSEQLFKEGALDVWLTNIIMKKGRPGILLSVLCPLQKRDEILNLIFRESTTIGIRETRINRFSLRRIIKNKHKIAFLDNRVIKKSVEFREALKGQSKTPLYIRLKNFSKKP